VTVIDRRSRLGEVPEALRYLGQGHAKGKLVAILEQLLAAVPGRMAPRWWSGSTWVAAVSTVLGSRTLLGARLP
jgi:hypothetical protein